MAKEMHFHNIFSCLDNLYNFQIRWHFQKKYLFCAPIWLDMGERHPFIVNIIKT